MSGALRLANDEPAVEQLQALARLEDAEVDEPVVLDARPAANGGLRQRGRSHEP